MNITVKLSRNAGRVNNSSFLIADNEQLHLDFTADIALADTFITARNGDRTVKHRVANLSTNGWNVPAELHTAGALEVIVEVLANCTAVRKFYVEPIAMKEIDTGFEAYGVLAQYDKAITRLAEVTDKLIERCNGTDKRIEDIDAFLKRLEDY